MEQAAEQLRRHGRPAYAYSTEIPVQVLGREVPQGARGGEAGMTTMYVAIAEKG